MGMTGIDGSSFF